jgi:carboxymethylenebutenolidase
MTQPAGAAGRAYLVVPEEGPGPGVLVLHSWWGLTRGVKDQVEALADAGFSALAPDLLGGALPETAAEAAAGLQDTSADVTAGLILSSVVALRARSADPEAPVGVVGYSMGGSWALWTATRQPASVAAVVDYYGHTNLDVAELRAQVLCHFAEDDPLVSGDDAVELQAHLLLLERPVEVHRYRGARHFFAETGVPMLDAAGESGTRSLEEVAAAELAWSRTVRFLGESLSPSPQLPG